MRIDIITLFPDMFKGPFDESIIKRGIDRKLAEINIHNLRNWGIGKHQVVDDRPYGGGVGMVLMAEPIFNALNDLRTSDSWVIALTASGNKFNQQTAVRLKDKKHIILLAGHYEGFDQRILDNYVDEEVSIGDFVLTGGELPAMVITDCIIRLIPGVLNKEEALMNESFSSTYALEHPQYTRPEDFKGYKVPSILLEGHHKKIEDWKKEQSIFLTKKRRPDLIK